MVNETTRTRRARVDSPWSIALHRRAGGCYWSRSSLIAYRSSLKQEPRRHEGHEGSQSNILRAPSCLRGFPSMIDDRSAMNPSYNTCQSIYVVLWTMDYGLSTMDFLK